MACQVRSRVRNIHGTSHGALEVVGGLVGRWSCCGSSTGSPTEGLVCHWRSCRSLEALPFTGGLVDHWRSLNGLEDHLQDHLTSPLSHCIDQDLTSSIQATLHVCTETTYKPRWRTLGRMGVLSYSFQISFKKFFQLMPLP